MRRSWVAASYGALDVRERPSAVGADVEYILLPTLPSSEPIGLQGEPAALWRRLVAGPVSEDELGAEQRALVREFEEFGLATRDLGHPARTTSVSTPWLVSPLHELVYALVGSVARDLGVGVVFIKGPALHLQGIREREHSGDVDLWVEPQGLTALCNGLSKWGWSIVQSIWDGPPLKHSVTLQPGSWGCEVDVHYDLPGIARSGMEAFTILREWSEPLTFASTTVAVPTAPPHAVIFALHAMRPSVGDPAAHPASEQIAQCLNRAGADTISAAQQLRADAALAPVLSIAFPAEFTTPDYEPPLNWRWRMQRTRVRAYATVIAEIPAVDRVRFVLRLLWPKNHAALTADAVEPQGHHNAFRVRLHRLLRGLRHSLSESRRGQQGGPN